MDSYSFTSKENLLVENFFEFLQVAKGTVCMGRIAAHPVQRTAGGRGVARRTGGASAAVTAGRDQGVRKEWKTNTVIFFLLYNTNCFEIC